MRTLLTMFIFLMTVAAMAQNNFRPINRDSVKLAVTDSKKDTYYSKLFERFNQFDTTLTPDDYRLIYYGFVFQDEYFGYAGDKEREITDLVKKRKYDKASDLCDQVLVKMPVGLKANFFKGLILAQMAVMDSARTFMVRYTKLKEAVLSTGNGLTCETAFKTIFVSDEYDIVRNHFEMSSLAQSFKSPCDKLRVTKSKLYDQNTIYFDTSETFMEMQQKLDKLMEKQ